MIIQRNSYLQQLIDGRENGLVKIVTGIRRCGKSFLLFRLFVEHLRSEGVADDHIIRVALDDVTAAPLRDALALYEHIRSQMTGSGLYFILLDEVQLVPRFEEVLNSLLRLENADVYVTGSNSRFLSSDIITEFRGRGDEIRVFPLSFAEFCQVTPLPQDEAWAEYYTFGGLPHVLSLTTEAKKINYLQQLVESV
ncbi:MAG: ATP-binding protein, partial [Alloprevotella sp.]